MKPVHHCAQLPSAQIELEIPFHDIDPMAVAWHGHYIKYFEHARPTLLRSIDYDYPQMKQSGYFWPIVECRIKYVKSAYYGQRIRVTAVMSEFENRIRIDYRIVGVDSGEKLTVGRTLQVAVDATTGEMQFVSPAALWERIERWRASC